MGKFKKKIVKGYKAFQKSIRKLQSYKPDFGEFEMPEMDFEMPEIDFGFGAPRKARRRRK